MSNPWFRMYAEFSTDPKVQMLDEKYQRRLVMLFCIRCNNDVTLHDEEIAFQLRISSDEWSATKAEFIRRGFIDSENKLLNWDKRQFRSDSSAERVRKHREANKKAGVTKCNVTVTPPDTDTDTDTDTEKKRVDNNISDARAKNDFQKIYDAGSSLFPSLATRNTSPIQNWIAEGCVAELDAVPALEAAHRSKIAVKSWQYFDGAVREAIERRKNPQPKGISHATSQHSTHNDVKKRTAFDNLVAGAHRAVARRPKD